MNESEQRAPCEVPEPVARAELERLLSDPRFHGTERARSILQYLAERRFDGQDDAVKAYTIALDVLGRSSNFDPSSDPIVRIEMSRLRSALTQYYEAYGDPDGVSIHLPIGHYVAVFTRSVVLDRPTDEEVEDIATAGEECPATADVQQALPAERNPWRLYAGTAVVTLAAFSVGAVWYGSRPAYTDKPTVAIVMSAADERLERDAVLTRDTLLTALTQFQTLTVSSDPMLSKSLSRALRPAASNAYRIEMKYYGDEDDRSVWWQIIDARSADVLKSGLERVSADGKTSFAVRTELAATLSRRFATTRGVINNIETYASAIGSLGNACVLRAEHKLDDGGPNDLKQAAECLERTVAIEPANADATAALSRVLMAEIGDAGSSGAATRSISLANRAVSLAPLSDRAQVALMMAQLYSGRSDLAIAAGNRALALNPNNPDVAAKLATVLFASGYWDAGVSMAEDAARSVDAVPRDASLVLALDAYRRGDFSNASLLAEQINCSDFVVRALRAASLGQLRSPQAAERLDRLREMQPDFEEGFASAMTLRRYQPATVASIKDGLTRAGAQFTTGSVH
jgi:tetratricopeptide (TPR) repeat protein